MGTALANASGVDGRSSHSRMPSADLRRSARPVSGWPGVWAAAGILTGWHAGSYLRSGVLPAIAVMRLLRCAPGQGLPPSPAAGSLALLIAAVAVLGVACVELRGRSRRAGVLAAWVLAACILTGALSGWRGVVREGEDAGEGVVPTTPAFHLLRIQEAGLGSSGTAFRGSIWASSGRAGWKVHREPCHVRGSWGGATTGTWIVRGRSRDRLNPGRGGSGVLDLDRAYRLDSRPAGSPMSARLAERRRAIGDRWAAVLGRDAGTLAGRIFLGPTLPLSPGWNEPFRRSGTLHLLAISGLHLGLLGGLAWLAVRVATRGARWSRWVALSLLAAFTVLIGSPPSSQRAIGMAWIMALGPGWGRRTRLWNAWGWMAAVLPMLDPPLPAGASYTLSLSATAGVLLGPRFLTALICRLTGKHRRGRSSLYLDLPGACVGAMLLTAPWSWLHFGVIYPFGLAANLVAVPCMAWVLVCLLPSAVAISLGAGPGSPFVALGRGAAEGFLGFLRVVSEWTGRWPVGWEIGSGRALACCLLLGFLLWLGARLLESRPARVERTRRTGIPSWLAVGFSAAVPLALLTVDCRPAARAPLEVRFLEVGEGDAIFVRLPGARWMIDTGRGGRAGEHRMVDPLLAAGVRRLDRVWITHGHLDHWGGLRELLGSPIRVDTLVIPGDESFPAEFWQILATAAQRPVLLRKAAPWARDLAEGVSLRLLHPEPGLMVGDHNNRSFVLELRQSGIDGRIRFGILLVGDLEQLGERILLEKGVVGRVDVLQLGHHGSRTSGDPLWWKTTAPFLAVASSGSRNRFGFPHQETVDAAARNGARLVRTDQTGSVRIGVYRDRVELRREFLRPVD